MKRKRSYFNQEEIRILKENPNTATVTSNRLSVTLKAKESILELIQAGWTSRRIVEELGYDPKILGENRIKNMGLARNLWDLLKNESTSDILVDVSVARDNPAYRRYTWIINQIGDTVN